MLHILLYRKVKKKQPRNYLSTPSFSLTLIEIVRTEREHIILQEKAYKD